MELLKLVWAFFKIGMISFGGGGTTVGIIKDEALRSGWLTDVQFAQIVSIAQVTPGPVALNAATLVGFMQGGVLGAILATLSVVSFPMLAITAAMLIAGKIRADKEKVSAALRVGTLSLVAMTFINLSMSPSVKGVTIIIGLGSFSAAVFTKINPLMLIIASGIVGGLVYTLF
jgi:chromate transporter